MSKQKIVTLTSGLRVAADEMKEVETVSVGVFVNTGSRNESTEISGISHFLEHMAFKGTEKRSSKRIAEEFEGIGGRINAYTSKEKTVYYAKVLKQHAEFALEFLSDILQNSIFDKVELEKERGVILQEIAMTNDTPDDIIFDYQITDTRTGVDDNVTINLWKTQFNTGCIAPVFHGLRPRTGDGTSHPPKFNLYHFAIPVV